MKGLTRVGYDLCLARVNKLFLDIGTCIGLFIIFLTEIVFYRFLSLAAHMHLDLRVYYSWY